MVLHIFLPIVLAVAPSLFLLKYFHKKDREKPEPKKKVILVFFFGIMSILPAMLLQIAVSNLSYLFSISPYLLSFFEAFIVAGLCEEFMKQQVVKQCIYNRGGFDEYSDGIIYAITAGLGFACFENVIYVLDGGITVAIIRAFTSIPLHACASGIMGYFIGRAYFAATGKEEARYMRRGLLIAVFIHGLYNFVLFIQPISGLLPSLILIPLIPGIFIILEKSLKKAKILDKEHNFG